MELSSRLQQVRAFNIFLSIFLLMGIVLSNGYKGVVITDLTSPASEARMKTFQEAMDRNYSILHMDLFAILDRVKIALMGTARSVIPCD